MNVMNIIAGIIGLVFGFVIAYVNYLISKKTAKQNNVTGVMAGNMARLVLDIGALAVGFLVCKLTGLSYAFVLIPIAVGLSVGGLLLLKKLTASLKGDNQV